MKYRGRDYSLDMQSTLEFEVEIRRRNLKRSNHYTRVIKKVIDGVVHYLLYKSEKSEFYRYYPLAGRIGI